MPPLLAEILDSAGRAPSAHNTQPWLIEWQDTSLCVSLQWDRRLTAVDPTNADAFHAIGALLENVVLTLRAAGLEPAYECTEQLQPQQPVVTVTWRPGEKSPDLTLYRMIPIRRTSRMPYDDRALTSADLAALHSAVSSPCDLHLLHEPPAIQKVRELVAQATALQLADEPVARELYEWLRFSRRDARWGRDGLNAACMHWKWWEAAGARCLLAPRMLRWLTRLGLHKLLCASVDSQAPKAPTLCLLTLQQTGIRQRIEAGRVLERVWLTAAARGLVTHPLSAGLDVASTRPAVLAAFGLPPDQPYVNLFRIGTSRLPARSPRLPADEIVTYSHVATIREADTSCAVTSESPAPAAPS